MRPNVLASMTLIFLAAPLWGQSSESGGRSSTVYLVEVHQITPGPGLRDVNSRGGWGGMLGIEGGTNDFSCRFLVEAGSIPTQFADPHNPGKKYTPLTWGWGVDGIFHLGRPNLNIYALVGVHFDYWEATITYTSTNTSSTDNYNNSSSSAGRLGIRAGIGLKAGPLFVEARYRKSAGDLRIPSDQGGAAGSWGAVELGAGFRIRY